jgi:hypothetical protein
MIFLSVLMVSVMYLHVTMQDDDILQYIDS